MTYTLNANIPTEVEDQEATLAAVLSILPVGTTAVLQPETIIIDATELSDDYIGYGIRHRVGMPDEFSGIIEKVYQRFDGGVSVIVNDRDYFVDTWDAVEVVAPHSAGKHDAGEQEESPVSESEDAESETSAVLTALALAAQHVNFYGPTTGLLTRSTVETVVADTLTDEEFVILMAALQEDFSAMISPAIPGLIMSYFRALRGN